MASERGEGADLWAELVSQEEEPPPKTQIAVVYERRRAQNENPSDIQISRSSGENRVSFAPRKRTSWKRSLSVRGRESIIVAAGADFGPRPKQRGAQKNSKRGLRAKKAGKEPPDLRKEKAYFQEVDSFDLIEESPSPKNFDTWAMGTKHDYVVHDLPAILERWRISKLAYSCRSPLYGIMETSIGHSGQGSCGGSDSVSEKTPIRALRSRIPFKYSSYGRSITSGITKHTSIGALNENCILSSFDALRIEDEGVTSVVRDKDDACKDSEGDIQKDLFPLRPESFTGECLSAFAQLILVCRQSAPIRLSEVFSMYCDPDSIVKIGEGTYGEAFRAGETVCKLVPIDGNLLVNGEVQKKSGEVLEEVMLSLTLNSLRGQEGETNSHNLCTSFIETKDFRVCQGAYDASLVRAWEDWDEKHGSENDHPREFTEEQCYIVFVLADGGKDLESFVLLNFNEARSLLVQVTAALAVAETACEFEHRDLHWGNVLLRRKEDEMVDFTLQGKKMSIKTFGLAISIIDFTLSRINTGEAILFLNLSADPGLFEGPRGDKQAETYRKMKEVTEECWEGSFPKTNVLWLVYLVDILLIKKSFKRLPKDERDLRSFKKRLNSYESAKDALSDCFFGDLLDCDST